MFFVIFTYSSGLWFYMCLCVFACAQMCGCTVVCELWKFKCLFRCDVTGVTSFIQGITCF